MSGGAFNYEQYKISRIADTIENIIESNSRVIKGLFDDVVPYHYSIETLNKMKIALATLRRAERMATHIDYLISGDYDEEIFYNQWEKDLSNSPV